MAKSRRPDTPSSSTPTISLRTLENVLGLNFIEAQARYSRASKKSRSGNAEHAPNLSRPHGP